MNETKHYYYYETIIDKYGKVLTACGTHVDSRRDIDLQAPTCEACIQKLKEYESLRIE